MSEQGLTTTFCIIQGARDGYIYTSDWNESHHTTDFEKCLEPFNYIDKNTMKLSIRFCGINFNQNQLRVLWQNIRFYEFHLSRLQFDNCTMTGRNNVLQLIKIINRYNRYDSADRTFSLSISDHKSSLNGFMAVLKELEDNVIHDICVCNTSLEEEELQQFVRNCYNLRIDNIHDGLVVCLAEELTFNRTLRSVAILNSEEDYYDYETFDALASSLLLNNTLERLCISQMLTKTTIGDLFISAIAHNNYGLKSLYLPEQGLSPGQEERLVSLLETDARESRKDTITAIRNAVGRYTKPARR